MIFLKSLLLGAVLGVVYDTFRIIRKLFSCGKISIFIQDVLFCLISALLTFLFLIAVNHGKLRGFIIFGEFLGAWVYFNTISQLILLLFDALFALIKKIKNLLKRFLFSPISNLWRRFTSILKKWNEKVYTKQKNIRRNLFLHLKNRVRIVYNKKNRKANTNSKNNRNVV